MDLANLSIFCEDSFFQLVWQGCGYVSHTCNVCLLHPCTYPTCSMGPIAVWPTITSCYLFYFLFKKKLPSPFFFSFFSFSLHFKNISPFLQFFLFLFFFIFFHLNYFSKEDVFYSFFSFFSSSILFFFFFCSFFFFISIIFSKEDVLYPSFFSFQFLFPFFWF